MRVLPPPKGTASGVPDLDEGFPPAARQAIDQGERALVNLRENTVTRWISAGAAWKALQSVAMNRSRSNSPSGRRYNQVYAVLSYAWPELAKVHKGTRSDAIWLFENEDAVRSWLATLTQNDRDRWTHPTTLRRQFEKRHPYLLPDKPAPSKSRAPRNKRAWNKQPLGERSREDLEALIGELGEQLVDREREAAEKDALLDEKDRRIAQLENDLAWEKTTRRQLEAGAAPGRSRLCARAALRSRSCTR